MVITIRIGVTAKVIRDLIFITNNPVKAVVPSISLRIEALAFRYLIQRPEGYVSTAIVVMINCYPLKL